MRIHTRRTLAIAAATVVLPFQGCCGDCTATESGLDLSYIPASTVKLSQLIGDHDKHLQQDTLSRTEERYGVIGADTGLSFDHCDGRIIFVFGDTMGIHKADTVVQRRNKKGQLREIRSDAGSRRAGDSIGYSRSTSPEALELEFFTDADGNYLRVRPDGERLPGFQIPNGGICLDGRVYLAYNESQSAERYPDAFTAKELARYGKRAVDRHLYKKSSLAEFDEATGSFTTLRELSNIPEGGKFVTVSMHHQTTSIPGLPDEGPHVLVWGTGVYRKSACYLSVCPARTFATGEGTLYFAGLDEDGGPVWSALEAKAAPIVDGDLGNVSVTWSEDLGIWIMLYDIRGSERGIVMRHAHDPYGTWSEPQFVIDANSDPSWREYTHTEAGDGLAGPIIGEAKNDPESTMGGLFAPYVIERFTHVEGDRLDLDWTVSTWNPYVVVLMQSSFEIKR